MMRSALALALSLFSLPALAEPLSLKTISAYLNGIATAESGFTQLNSDGSKSKGQLYIKRPGRVRFEYAPPDKALVLAAGGQVAIFDDKSNQPPEQYPLKRTPLNLILAAKVDLGRADMVQGLREFEGNTHVLAQDPEHPEYGTIELIFAPDPVRLVAWIITDDLGQPTEVRLSGLQAGAEFKPSLFNITDEINRRK